MTAYFLTFQCFIQHLLANCIMYVRNCDILVQLLSHVQLLLTPWTHTRLPCPLPSPGLAQTHVHWVDDATVISSSVVPFSYCLLSFPASESFPKSRLFLSGGQSIGASASASVLPMNIQGLYFLNLVSDGPPDELLWVSGLSRCDLLPGMKNASSSP